MTKLKNQQEISLILCRQNSFGEFGSQNTGIFLCTGSFFLFSLSASIEMTTKKYFPESLFYYSTFQLVLLF